MVVNRITNLRPFTSLVFWPLLLSFLVFFLCIDDFYILNTSNIDWLLHDDMRQSYIGWLFFRSDNWHFPIGLNPNYGIETSSSIVFTDSIPAFAILFKFLSPYIAEPFQYQGIYIALSVYLQSLLSFILSKQITKRSINTYILSIFFTTAPIFIFRHQMHISLMSHFLIIAAISNYKTAGIGKKHFYYNAIFNATLLVHAYFFFMVSAVWAASLLSDGVKTRHDWLRMLKIVLLSVSNVLIFGWVIGYFTVSDGVADGLYGQIGMNVFALWDTGGWSYILPDFQYAGTEFEGFNYLGMGLILLVVLSFLKIKYSKKLIAEYCSKYPEILLICVILTVLSVTHSIYIGQINIKIPIPPIVVDFLGIVRASGRLFWPVYYLLMILIFIFIDRIYKKKSIGIFLFAVFVQVIDTSAGWNRITPSENIQQVSWTGELDALLTGFDLSNYDAIRTLPLRPNPPYWAEVTYFAVQNGLATDAVYMSRWSEVDTRAQHESTAEAISSMQLNERAIYIIENKNWSMFESSSYPRGQDIVIDYGKHDILILGIN